MSSRILLPVAIGGSILAQVPVSSWEQLSAVAMMGGVLMWLVSKTLPAFALAIATINTQNAALLSKTLESLNSWHNRTLESTVELTAAITKNSLVLESLQKHCEQSG